MSMSNSFSNAMTSSTVSRLSAPRSSMKLAPLESFSRSTPSSSTMMSLTFSSTLLLMSSSSRSEGSASDDHPAVDHHHLPRDVAGQVGREKEHRVGDVVRTA